MILLFDIIYQHCTFFGNSNLFYMFFVVKNKWRLEKFLSYFLSEINIHYLIRQLPKLWSTIRNRRR